VVGSKTGEVVVEFDEGYVYGDDTISFQSTQPSSVNDVTFTFSGLDRSVYTIEWGDGTDTTLIADGSDQVLTSDYAAGSDTFGINIIGDASRIITFRCDGEATALFDINEFDKATGITSLRINDVNQYCTGYIDNLSATLTSLYIDSCGAFVTYNKGTIDKWANSNITIKSNIGQGKIDTFLVSYNTENASLSGTLNLGGYNIFPSATGNTAITALTGKGKTVITRDKVVNLQTVQPATIDQVTFTFKITAGDTVYVDWGDSNQTTVVGTGSNQTAESNYTTNNTTYDIQLLGDLGSVETLYFNEVTMSGNIQEVTQLHNCTINDIRAATTMEWNGSVNYLPTGLTYLYMLNLGTNLTGSINYLPTGLTYLYLYNLGTNLTGSINDLPTGLTYLQLLNLGTNLTGSINDLPTGLTTLQLLNLGTNLTGSINDLPTGLTYLYLVNLGTNLTGSINDLPTGLTYLNLTNLGTNLTGSINDLPTGLTYLNLTNLGTNLTGSISDLPTGLTTLNLTNLGTGIDITTGTMPAWAATTITIQSGYSTAAVDGFLNAWTPTAGTGTQTINLSGSGAGIANQPRSSASDAAVTTLNGKGKTIITN
jgi:hypothetical protein